MNYSFYENCRETTEVTQIGNVLDLGNYYCSAVCMASQIVTARKSSASQEFFSWQLIQGRHLLFHVTVITSVVRVRNVSLQIQPWSHSRTPYGFLLPGATGTYLCGLFAATQPTQAPARSPSQRWHWLKDINELSADHGRGPDTYFVIFIDTLLCTHVSKYRAVCLGSELICDYKWIILIIQSFVVIY